MKEYFLPYLNYKLNNSCDAFIFVFTENSIMFDESEKMFYITMKPETDDYLVSELYRYLGNPGNYENIYFTRNKVNNSLKIAKRKLLIQSFTQR
jgi:hypothetical protein